VGPHSKQGNSEKRGSNSMVPHNNVRKNEGKVFQTRHVGPPEKGAGNWPIGRKSEPKGKQTLRRGWYSGGHHQGPGNQQTTRYGKSGVLGSIKIEGEKNKICWELGGIVREVPKKKPRGSHPVAERKEKNENISRGEQWTAHYTKLWGTAFYGGGDHTP